MIEDMEGEVYHLIFDSCWRKLSEEHDLNTELEAPLLITENGIFSTIVKRLHEDLDDDS